jgi:hypothetical protein
MVPGYFVVFDGLFSCNAAMLRRGGHGEVPFYEGLAGDEGHIVEVDDLGVVSR